MSYNQYKEKEIKILGPEINKNTRPRRRKAPP